MATFKLNEVAKADLRKIYRYGVFTYGEMRADEYYNTLFDQFELIAEQPLLFPLVPMLIRDYRRAICGVDNIYYRVTEAGVEIMRVLGRQDFGDERG